MPETEPLELCKLVDTPDTKVYTMSIAPFQEQKFFDRVYAGVSRERRAKTDKMQFLKGKCLSLGVEYLLQQVCRSFDLNYRMLQQVTDEYGKPGFDQCPYHFNLSHSGEQVMCVMSRFPVGCDVERVRWRDMGIGDRFFSDKEKTMLKNCGNETERQQLFFKLWTLKESFMKCTGLGFHLPLKDFSIEFDSDKIRVEQSVDDANYSLYASSADGYQYAWCVRGKLI